LHLPCNYGNAPWILSRAERKLDIKSDLIVFSHHPFYKNYDRNLAFEYYLNIPDMIKKVVFLKWALKNYDIFHFNTGATILDHFIWGLNYFDLPLIKKAGKKIVVTYQGSDARQKDYFIKHFGWGPYNRPYTWRDKLGDINKRMRIEKMAKYADHIFCYNPDLMHILPKKTEFMPYPSVDIHAIKPNLIQKRNRIMILHAPSKRAVKGTDIIISAIKRLAKKYPLELILIENMPHDKALEYYKKADIAVDQLEIGWYGGFAVETMAMGIPTICFLRNDDLRQFVSFKKEIPIVNANKDSLERVLQNLIQDSVLRKKIGNKSRKFVEKYHDPISIAQKMINIYQAK